MKETIQALRQSFERELQAAQNSDAVEKLRIAYLGKKGSVTELLKGLKSVAGDQKKEMGQPMHAFDCAKVDQIEVKRFEAPFSFTTLDGTQRQADENTLMICCKDQPVAIAGIMGGLDSEIEDDTDSLLLESANFDAVSVRKSSTRLGLRTDASMRYEKTLDPEMCPTAIGRFMKLLLDIDPGAQVIALWICGSGCTTAAAGASTCWRT